MYIIFFILNLLDIVTTYLILSPNPNGILEFNPVMEVLISTGWGNFAVIKILVSLIIIIGLYSISKEDSVKAKFGLHLIVFMYMLVVLNNLSYLLTK